MTEEQQQWAKWAKRGGIAIGVVVLLAIVGGGSTGHYNRTTDNSDFHIEWGQE